MLKVAGSTVIFSAFYQIAMFWRAVFVALPNYTAFVAFAGIALAIWSIYFVFRLLRRR